MPHRNNLLIRTAGSLVLFTLALALLWPVFRASAERTQIQELKSPQDINAPMKPIQPVSVVVVNFQELARAEAKKESSGLKQQPAQIAVPAPMTIPEPVELGANEFPAKESRPEAKAEVIGPSLVSPSASASFAAQFDEPKVGTGSRTIPPDTTGAVGPSNIFSTLNSNYRIQNKTTGAMLSTVAMNTFWEPLNSATPGPSPTPAAVSGAFHPRIQ